LTTPVTAIARRNVSVIAGLTGLQDTVAAKLISTIGITTIAIGGTAVVALLVRRVDGVVATIGQGAVGLTAITACGVAVIAGLARLQNAVATKLIVAIGITTITAAGITVVALLIRIDVTIAARGQGTIGLTTITIDYISVVTLLGALENPISASDILTIRITTGGTIAFFVRQIDDIVAAGRQGAVGLAAISIEGSTVITLLAGEGVVNTISAERQGTIAFTTITV
jgi:hypothetical protein